MTKKHTFFPLFFFANAPVRQETDPCERSCYQKTPYWRVWHELAPVWDAAADCLAGNVVLIEPLDTNWTTESWSNFMGWFHRGSMQANCVFFLFLSSFFLGHLSLSPHWPLLEFFLSFFPGQRIREIHKERDALTKLYLECVYSPPTCQSSGSALRLAKR